MGNLECMPEKVAEYCCIHKITSLIGIILIILTTIWIINYRGGFSFILPDQIFNWHPFIMTLGMILIFSQAILLFRTARECCKDSVKYIHASLLFVVIILSILGLIAAFQSHAMKNIPHMYTLHSWLGLMTVVFFIPNFIMAFTAFIYPGMCPAQKKIICPMHSRIGAGIFMLAVFTGITGVAEKSIFGISNYKNLPLEGLLCNVIGLLMAVYGILIIYLLKEAWYKREDKKNTTAPPPCPVPPPSPPQRPVQIHCPYHPVNCRWRQDQNSPYVCTRCS